MTAFEGDSEIVGAPIVHDASIEYCAVIRSLRGSAKGVFIDVAQAVAVGIFRDSSR
jgi:hypothetical protein